MSNTIAQMEKELENKKREAAVKQARERFESLKKEFDGVTFKQIHYGGSRSRPRYDMIVGVCFIRHGDFKLDEDTLEIGFTSESVSIGKQNDWGGMGIHYSINKNDSGDISFLRLYSEPVKLSEEEWQVLKKYVKLHVKAECKRLVDDKLVEPNAQAIACVEAEDAKREIGLAMDFPYVKFSGFEMSILGHESPFFTKGELYIVTPNSREYARMKIREKRDGHLRVSHLLQACDMGYVRGTEEACVNIERKLVL